MLNNEPEFTKEYLLTMLENYCGRSYAVLSDKLNKAGRPEFTVQRLKEIIGFEPVKAKKEQVQKAKPERKKDWDGGTSYYEEPLGPVSGLEEPEV